MIHLKDEPAQVLVPICIFDSC